MDKRQNSTADSTDIPVLICSYNRPELLRELLNFLRENQILNVYFYSDGPKSDDESIIAVKATRSIFREFFPVHPKNKSFLANENLGCRNGMNAAITWFFQQVDFGVILEDDCMPSRDFFRFIHEVRLTTIDRNDVFCLAGSRNLGSPITSHTLSSFPFIWGWATWSEKWEKYKLNFDDANELSRRKAKEVYSFRKGDSRVLNNFQKLRFEFFWTVLLKLAGTARLDTWDYSLIATLWREEQKCVVPQVNMVVNVGFNEMATHTKGSRPGWVSTTHSHLSKNHLDFGIDLDSQELDRWSNKEIYRATFFGAFRLIFGQIQKIIRRN